jgi:hypothetical protein
MFLAAQHYWHNITIWKNGHKMGLGKKSMKNYEPRLGKEPDAKAVLVDFWKLTWLWE